MPIVSGGGSGLVATKHLTSANILALNTTPITLVAAQGAGKAVFPQNALVVYKAGATPYTPAAATRLEITTSALTGSGLSLIEMKSFDVMLSSATNLAASFFDGTSSDLTFPQIDPANMANQPLVAFATVGNPTLGNGTLDLTIYYTIVTI